MYLLLSLVSVALRISTGEISIVATKEINIRNHVVYVCTADTRRPAVEDDGFPPVCRKQRKGGKGKRIHAT